jgi:mRNA-degrading endonuclease RelE of RelBE toxin-antitoxin system
MHNKYEIRLTDEFIEGLSRIWSERVLDHIRSLVNLLTTTPEMGSPDIRKSLRHRYGDNIRKLNVSTFVILYRFDGTVVEVLAVEYGPNVG